MTKQDKKGYIVLGAIAIVIIAVITISILVSGKNNKSTNTYKAGESERTESYENSPQEGDVNNIAENGSKSELSENEIINVKPGSYKKEFIAAVYLEGVIEERNQDYDQKWLMDTIKSLKNNKRNVAIALYVDSPGGSVYCADEVYLALQDYKTSGKPVYVYQGPMSASGGYYISCAGDAIYANRNTLTGCIGVIFGQSVDITGLLEKVGIKSKTFHSGRNKTMLSPDEPLTKEQEEIMQSMCDEAYKQFVTIVANNRDMTYDQAAELSDGRLYSANQALQNGLIDGIDSWENMITILAEDVLHKPGITVAEFKKEKDKMPSVLDFVFTSISNIQEQSAAAKLGLPPAVLKTLEFDSYPAYLYQGF